MKMTEQEIKDNAPSGATHYEPDLMFIGTVYIRYMGNHPFYFCGGDWHKCNSYFEAKPLP